ncbi:MAG: hypothetical protein M1824_000701 [Vezdaea acicularis]|nr:MAG: hypothetical protein M1824_000701 [Vezdaea acicularis]
MGVQEAPVVGNAPNRAPLDLDADISSLKSRIRSLSNRRATLSSTILTSHTDSAVLSHAPTPVKTHAVAAQKHSVSNLHRLCAGCTTFLVHDPDPCAVDNGRVFGVRIEVFTDGKHARIPPSSTRMISPLTIKGYAGKYLAPYYLLLNRPSQSSSSLRIHRHTIPPCIPLPALAAQYLPQPSQSSVDPVTAAKRNTRPQKLTHLVRALRRELVSYHCRFDGVSKLREQLGLAPIIGKDGKRRQRVLGSYGVKDVATTDAEALGVRIDWKDGRVARMRMTKNGDVTKAVVMGNEGRERAFERALLGRLEKLGERLRDLHEAYGG